MKGVKKYFLTISILISLFDGYGQNSDLILTGSNSWILHTPDDGRTNLHIAPYTNGDWQWGLVYLENNGTLYTQGLESNNIKSLQTIELRTNGINSTEILMRKESNAYHSIYSNNSSFGIYNSSTNQSPIFINNTDYVGIGTTNPTEKLSVNGKIRAKEVKVETANWPDYVFEDGYDLKELERLEEFIKVNKHLPEIPSAKEVEENGVNLGEMNAKLLKKIEELTLHMIEMKKEINALKSKN